MRAVPRDGFLSERELRDRVDDFHTGPQTLERAADSGLLGLIEPPAFGGFGLSCMRLRFARESLGTTPVMSDLTDHWSICGIIMEKGTYSQFDFFLPQLA